MGIRIDTVTNSQTLDIIDHMVRSRQPHQIVTANLNFLALAQRDVELRRILLESQLVLCDGTPMLWFSRWLRHPLPERVAGSDLVPQLVARSAAHGHRLFFLGSTPEIVARCVENVKARHPSLPEPGFYAPPFADLLSMDHESICAKVRAYAPDILLVAMGCPKQEKWIAMHLRSLGVPVSIGIGATIDFLAGHVARAPVWMRRTGIEWLFRLLQEPRRLFGRYFGDFFVVKASIRRHLARFRGASPSGGCTEKILSTPAGQAIRHTVLTGALEEHVLPGSAGFKNLAQGVPEHWILDLSGLSTVDIAGVGVLCDLWRRLREARKLLVLVGLSPVAREAMEIMRLDEIFCLEPDLDAAQKRIARWEASLGPIVATRTEGQTLVISWEGEVTVADASKVADQTLAGLQASDCERCVLCLQQARFIDSSGLRVVRLLADAASREQVSFEVRGAPPALNGALAKAARSAEVSKQPGS